MRQMLYSRTDSKYVFASAFMDAQTAEMLGKWEVMTKICHSRMS